MFELTKKIFALLALGALLGMLTLFQPPTASQADSPTPTPRLNPARVSASQPSTQYRVFLPLVLASLPPLKKGVPLTYTDCANVTSMNAFWEFAWSPTPPNCAGVENVPMIWGAGDINKTLSGNSQWVMGFNEPDSGSQANLTPQQGADYWHQIEQQYPTRKLLSPASATEDTSHWLVNFRNAYIATYHVPPRLDGLAVHCFKWWASQCIDSTQQYINWANSWGTSEVWVTEFSFAMDPSCGAGASQSQALQMQQTYINWMTSQPKVTRYGWFASKIQGNEWWIQGVLQCFLTPLVDISSGQPTSFGNAYLPYR